MLKISKNEFLEPVIFTNEDKYKTSYVVNNDIIKEIKRLKKENKQLKDKLNFIKFKYFSEIGKNAESSINDYLRWK